MDETDILDFDVPEAFPEEVENQLDAILAELNTQATSTDSGFDESEIDLGDYDYVIDLYAMPHEEIMPSASEVFIDLEERVESKQEQNIKVEVKEIPRLVFEETENDVKEDFLDSDEDKRSVVQKLRNQAVEEIKPRKTVKLSEFQAKVVAKIKSNVTGINNAKSRTKKNQALTRKNYILIPKTRVTFKILENNAKILLIKDKENEQNGWEFTNFHNRGYKCPLCGKGIARRLNNVVWIKQPHNCRSIPFVVLRQKYEDLAKGIKITSQWWMKKEDQYNFFRSGKRVARRSTAPKVLQKSLPSLRDEEIIIPNNFEIIKKDLWNQFGGIMLVNDENKLKHGWGFSCLNPTGGSDLVCLICDLRQAKLIRGNNIPAMKNNTRSVVKYFDVYMNLEHGCESIPLDVFKKKEEDERNNVSVDIAWWKSMEKKYNFLRSEVRVARKSTISRNSSTSKIVIDEKVVVPENFKKLKKDNWIKNEDQVTVPDEKNEGRGWGYKCFGNHDLVCILCDRYEGLIIHDIHATKKHVKRQDVYINSEHGCDSISLEVFKKKKDDEEKNIKIDRLWWKNMEKKYNFNKFLCVYQGPEYGPSHFIEIPQEMFVVRQVPGAQEALLVRDEKDYFSGWEFVRYASSFSCSICSKSSMVIYDEGKLELSRLHKCGTVPFFLLQEKYNTLEAGLSIDPGWWLKKQREHHFKRPDRTQSEKLVVCKNISWIEIYYDGKIHAIIIKDPNNEKKGWEFSCKSKNRVCRICQTRRIIYTGQGFMMIDLNHECQPIDIEFLTIKYDLMIENYQENHTLPNVEKKEKNQKVADVIKNLGTQNVSTVVTNPKKQLTIVSKTSDPDVQILETMQSADTKVQETATGSTVFVSASNVENQKAKRRRKPTKIVVESQNEQVLKMLGEASVEIARSEQNNLSRKRKCTVTSTTSKNNSFGSPGSLVPVLSKRPRIVSDDVPSRLDQVIPREPSVAASKSSSNHEFFEENCHEEEFVEEVPIENPDYDAEPLDINELLSYRCPTVGEDDPVKRKKITQQISQHNGIQMFEHVGNEKVYERNNGKIRTISFHQELANQNGQICENFGTFHDNYQEQTHQSYHYQIVNGSLKELNQPQSEKNFDQEHANLDYPEIEQPSEFSFETKVEPVEENHFLTASNPKLPVRNDLSERCRSPVTIQRTPILKRSVVRVSQVPRMNYSNYPSIPPRNSFGQSVRVIAPKRYYRYTYEGNSVSRPTVIPQTCPQPLPVPRITANMNSNGQWRKIIRPTNMPPVVIRPAVRRQPVDQRQLPTNMQRMTMFPVQDHGQNSVRHKIYDEIEFEEEHEDDILVLN